MKQVMVVGGTNQIAAYLIPELLNRRYHVEVVSRAPRPPWITPNVRLSWQLHDLAAFPLSGPVERAVYLAPLGLVGQLETALAPGGRIVCFSSTSVVSKADSSSAAERALAAELESGERAVRDLSRLHAGEWTILRPTLVYGAGLDRNLTRIAASLEKWRVFPLPGSGSGRRQPVHAQDLARAAAASLERPEAVGKTYTLVGGTTLTYREMIERIFRSLGRSPRILPLPPAVLRLAVAAARLLPRWRDITPTMLDRINQDLVFDSGPARADLDYQPREFNPTGETWQRLDERR